MKEQAGVSERSGAELRGVLWQCSLLARHSPVFCARVFALHSGVLCTPPRAFTSSVLIFTAHGRLTPSVSCQNVKALGSEGKQESCF